MDLTQHALQQGLTPTVISVRWCLWMHNDILLDLLLEHMDIKVLQSKSSQLIRDLARCEDINLANRLLQAGLDIQSPFQQSDSFLLLKHLVENNSFQLIDWLNKKNVAIQESHAKKLLPIAVENGNLKIIEWLAGQAHASYLDALELKGPSDEEINQRLQCYCLSTPLPIVDHLITHHYPELKDQFKMITNQLSVLVRFPSVKDRSEVSQALKSTQSYIKSSFEYAASNLKAIEQLLPQCTTTSWHQLLQSIIKLRSKTNRDPLPTTYFNLRHSIPDEYITPLITLDKLELDPNSFSTTRYYHAWNSFHTLDRQNSLENTSIVIDLDEDCIEFNYTLPNHETVNINRLFVDHLSGSTIMFWNHATPEVLNLTQDHLNDLHLKVMNFSLREDNQRDFEALVARTYWLIATLCETERGTPHNAMMWLNLAYRKHNLPVPIPKLEHFFLDNTMLVLPMEEAVARWRTFFESVKTY
jgi:hypothetical protein